jgi:GH24 family phage-related lysozyme (muramidase)/LysM repeat protein
MKSFKQFLIESNIANIAAQGIASATFAAPPKPEARDYIINAMKQKEGFRPVAVKDTIATGQPTVFGYGTTSINPKTGKPIEIGEKITPEEAEELLNIKIDKDITPQMEKIPGWDDMTSGQQAALLSFAYNSGENFYGSKNYDQITKALKNKQWDRVPEVMKLYNKSGGKVRGGLVTRRETEGNLWTNGFSSSKKDTTTKQTNNDTEENDDDKIFGVSDPGVEGTAYPVTKAFNEIGTRVKNSLTNQSEQPKKQTEYIVKAGDTLTKIAGNNKSKLDAITKLNNILDPNKIKLGQKLIIPND